MYREKLYRWAKEITSPRGTVKCIFADGEQEIIRIDGTVERIDKYGNQIQGFDNLSTNSSSY